MWNPKIEAMPRENWKTAIPQAQRNAGKVYQLVLIIKFFTEKGIEPGDIKELKDISLLPLHPRRTCVRIIPLASLPNP